MSKSEPSEPPKKSAAWHLLGFGWVDDIKSESRKDITRRVISTLIASSIVATVVFIWTQWDWLIGGSKSITQFILNLLQTPIQLKVWVAFLIVVAVVWIFYLVGSKKRVKRVSTVFADFQTKLTAKAFRPMGELEAQVDKTGKVINEAIALIEQNVRFAKKNKTDANKKDEPSTGEVFAEIQKLRTQITEHTAQDPRFIATFKFIIDDNRAKGLKYLIEHGFSRDIEKAVPLILKSATFDEFLASAGLALDIDDSIQINVANAYKGGAMAFGVASRDNPLAEEHAKFTLERGKIVHMNNAAHRHFDWSYTMFKKQFGRAV